MSILTEIQELNNYVIDLRREFHENAELSLKEFWTATRIEKELDDIGIEHKRVGETGVLGTISGLKGAGKIIVLRADIDALPLCESSDRSYASKNIGVMHACGHDTHTAMLLAAARILFKHRDFAGTIKLIFQQAEEIGAGARQFIAQKVLDGAYRVFGIHVTPQQPYGKFSIKKGPTNASVDYFKITISGKKAHVSTPHLGADALYAGANIVSSLQGLTTRRTSPIDTAVIGVGVFNSGTSYNIVSDKTVIEGTIRTVNHDTRSLLCGELDRLSKNIAENYNTVADVEWKDFASPLINDVAVCDEISKNIITHFGKDALHLQEEVSLGGEDFAEFLKLVPGAFVYLGTRNDSISSTTYPAHNENFDIDERALVLGISIHVINALTWLGVAVN